MINKILYRNGNKGISIEIINKFEKDTKVKFPDDYKSFLVKYNGGEIDGEYFVMVNGDDKYLKENTNIHMEILYGLGNEIYKYNSIEYYRNAFDDYLPVRFFPIGGDGAGNYFCISLCENNTFGNIFYCFHDIPKDESLSNWVEGDIDKTGCNDMNGVYKLADSFTEFVNKLEPIPKENRDQIIKCAENIPFWKVAYFEIMSVERVWNLYKNIVKGRYVNMANECREIIDTAWESASKQISIDQKYVKICTGNILEHYDEDFAELSNKVMEEIGTLVIESNRRTNKYVSNFTHYNFSIICDYLIAIYNFGANGTVSNKEFQFVDNHELIKQEIERNSLIMEKLKFLETNEEIFKWCKENSGVSIADGFVDYDISHLF